MFSLRAVVNLVYGKPAVVAVPPTAPSTRDLDLRDAAVEKLFEVREHLASRQKLRQAFKQWKAATVETWDDAGMERKILQRTMAQFKATGQWSAAANLKLQLARAEENEKQIQLAEELTRKKNLSPALLNWVQRQTTRVGALENLVNTGTDMDPATQRVLFEDLATLDQNEVVGLLQTNPSIGQSLVEFQKMQIATKELAGWLNAKEEKEDFSSHIPKLMRETQELFGNWAQAIETLLETPSVQQSPQESTVQLLKQLKMALLDLKEKLSKETEAGHMLEVLYKNMVVLLPSFTQLGNRTGKEAWVQQADAFQYASTAIKIVQNPVKIVTLCSEFLKKLKNPEEQWSAVKTLIQIKQMMLTAEVSRNRTK